MEVLSKKLLSKPIVWTRHCCWKLLDCAIMAKTHSDPSIKIIAHNKQARFNYEIVETVEAGIVLSGSEIKSIRAGHINLGDSYARPDNGELYLLQAHVRQYSHDRSAEYDPVRKRKLLLHKHEINKLIGRVETKGMTLVPLKIYLKKGKAKLELAIAKGKHGPDKRRTIRERELDREAERALKQRVR